MIIAINGEPLYSPMEIGQRIALALVRLIPL